MNKQVLWIPGLFALGLLAGLLVMQTDNDGSRTENKSASDTLPGLDQGPGVSNLQQSSAPERIQQLETEIISLRSRIEQLEQAPGIAQSEAQISEPDDDTATASEPLRFSLANQVLTAEKLISVGINEALAYDIIQRRNDIELRKLELRDRATREGYIGTRRYRQELSQLNEEQFDLREEIGEDAYDRYLYASGQNNRVQVLSVMNGSAAEQIGIKSGDIIMSYADQRIFEWDELQKATTEGARGEYVSINLLRNNSYINLWIPRGPLGVRLDMTQVDPG